MVWGSNFPTSPGALSEIVATARAGLACLRDEEHSWIFGKTAQHLNAALDSWIAGSPIGLKIEAAIGDNTYGDD
jgi:hypothetical protein